MAASDEPARPGIRERTRQAIRSELSETALQLFAERGFDETTARQIAAAVGVSERTFFRYFASKEDVVLGVLDELGVALADRLAARPASESPSVALRRSFDLMTETLALDPERSLAMLRLTRGVPSLRARQIDKQDRWASRLADVLAERLGVATADDLRPSLYATTALGALDVAVTRWDALGGATPLSEIIDEAFAVVFGAPHA
jgi:AcrR family transcriptional regulator